MDEKRAVQTVGWSEGRREGNTGEGIVGRSDSRKVREMVTLEQELLDGRTARSKRRWHWKNVPKRSKWSGEEDPQVNYPGCRCLEQTVLVMGGEYWFIAGTHIISQRFKLANHIVDANPYWSSSHIFGRMTLEDRFLMMHMVRASVLLLPSSPPYLLIFYIYFLKLFFHSFSIKVDCFEPMFLRRYRIIALLWYLA